VSMLGQLCAPAWRAVSSRLRFCKQ